MLSSLKCLMCSTPGNAVGRLLGKIGEVSFVRYDCFKYQGHRSCHVPFPVAAAMPLLPARFP